MLDTGCHCLCSVVHPDQRGICTGEGIRKMPFNTDGKIVQVSMCVPCYTAATGTTNRKERKDG